MTLSIIATFYNCEKYAKECLDSILAQTMLDWECICVDDCSSDDTAVILDSYAAKDKRIHVIHQPSNLGNAARSRNVGLKVAQNDLVTFLDGDDVLVPTAIENLMHVMNKTGADAVNGWILPFHQDILAFPIQEDVGWRTWQNKFLLRFWNKEKGFLRANAVACIFRRSVWSEMRFNEALYHDEDYMFMQQYLLRAKHIATAAAPVYRYRLHDQSLTGVLQTDIYISSVLVRLNEDAEIMLPAVMDNPVLKGALIRKDTQDFYRRMIRKIVRKGKDKTGVFADLDLVRPAWNMLSQKGIVDKKYLTPYQRCVLGCFNRGHYNIVWWVLRLFG